LLDVRGAAFAYLEREDCVARISPTLTQDQFDDRYLDYLKRCLLADTRGEWVHARYEASWALASWFKRSIAGDENSPRLIALRQWLGETYKAAPALRDALLNGFLEHVVGQPSASRFFSAWKKDSELGSALRAARLWNDDAASGPSL
jgi:hypothetical protein